MNCSQCQGIEEVFSQRFVDKKLSSYRTKGADKTTRMLIEALINEEVEGLTHLDIGGGVGAIQHDLLAAGVKNATDVDASQAYLNAAQEEANNRGLEERVKYLHGNFVDMADQVDPADIVTLDRVICCYHDMNRLVSLSAARARKLYGLVYPRVSWWMKILLPLENFIFWLQRSPFRAYLHPDEAVEAVLGAEGFTRRTYRKTLAWQVVVYSR